MATDIDPRETLREIANHPIYQPGGMMYDSPVARQMRGTRCLALVNSTHNPSVVLKGTIMYAAYKLIQALQCEFNNGEIAIPSQDIKDSRKGVEIAVMFNPFNSPKKGSTVDNITEFLSNKAVELDLPFRNFVLQPDSFTNYYTEEQLEYVAKLGKKIQDDPRITEQYFEELASEAEQKKIKASKRRGIGSFKDVPNAQNVAALPLQKAKLDRLRRLQGPDLEIELKNMMATLEQASKAPKTALVLLLMIASGISGLVTVWVKAAALLAAASSVAFAVSLIGVVFGVAVAVATCAAILLILAAVGLVAIAAWTAVKGCRNVLIVANNTSKDIVANMEYIENGERSGVTAHIPAADRDLDAYWAGLYIYDKYNIMGQAAGFFGTTFGISFNSELGSFSVGMDCPNTIFGGNNSIAVTDQEHAQNAMIEARDHDHMDIECNTNNRRISGRITSIKGATNWARVIVDEVGYM